MSVFCEKCQTKNRQDERRRHRPFSAIQNNQRLVASMMLGLKSKAKLEYECERYRDDDRRVVPSEDEDY